MKNSLQKLYIVLMLSLVSLTASAEQSIKVVTTTNILADSLRAILPDSFKVHALMASGVDPHLYRATHGDIKRLLKAELIVYNGLHLEGRMQEPLEKISRNKSVLAITDAISTEHLVYVGPSQADPHIWMDVQLWQQGLAYLSLEIAKQYPEQQPAIEKKWQNYKQQLQQLDQMVKQQIQRIPKSQRILITAHDAFAYFGKRYRMEVDALQGVSTLSEFGLNDIQRLKNKIIKNNINAVFLESTISPRFIQSLQAGLQADNHSIKLGGTLHSDSLGIQNTPAGTYIGMMQHNAKTIANALSVNSP